MNHRYLSVDLNAQQTFIYLWFKGVNGTNKLDRLFLQLLLTLFNSNKYIGTLYLAHDEVLIITILKVTNLARNYNAHEIFEPLNLIRVKMLISYPN